MGIKELCARHRDIIIKTPIDNSLLNKFVSVADHTKLSIEFAISVLEELRHSVPFYGEEVDSKIQELKTYLDEKSQ